MKWDIQVKNCTSKANKVLEMIKKTFKFPCKENIRLLYTSLVRPHLDYAVSSWSPYFEKDIKQIEKV